MAYVTTADAKVYIRNVVNKNSTTALADGFDNAFIARAVQRGYSEIRRALVRRGYTAAQVDSWDDREEFNLDLATYWALTDAHNVEAIDLWVNKYDRREELETCAVLIDGELVAPGLPETQVARGQMENLDYDAFPIHDEDFQW